LRWLTFADADVLARDLHHVHPLNRTVRLALLQAVKARAVPLGTSGLAHVTEHLAYLSGPARALERAAALDLEPSRVAVIDDQSAVPWTAVTVLAGSGIGVAVTPWSESASAATWSGPDGSRVRVAYVAPGGDARSLGLVGPDDMAGAIERWLTRSPVLLAHGTAGTHGDERETLVVDASPVGDVGVALGRVSTWNQRFAYPRIDVGSAPDTGAPITVHSRANGTERCGPVGGPVPDPGVLRRIAEQREQWWNSAAADSAAVLAAVLGTPRPRSADLNAGRATVLDAIGADIRTRFSGTLVWNPTPYRRTDMAVTPDGSQRLVTDVPAWGYAFLVDTAGRGGQQSRTIDPRDITLECRGFSAQLDERSGAIRSVVDAGGREWVRPAGPGLNAVSGARLEGAEPAPAPAGAVRMTLQRWSPEFGEITSTITAHSDLPWLDVENVAAPLGSRGVEYHFGFALTEPEALWEIPLGYERSTPPLGPLAHLRWLALRERGGAAWLAGAHTAYASVGREGHIRSYAPRNRVQYRFGVTDYRISPAESARLGWSVVPFVARPATGHPDGRLPTHGQLLRFDEAGIALLGITPTAEGDGVTVYFSDWYGEHRYVAVTEGVLGFDRATAIDFVGRQATDPISRFADGFVVHVPPRGIAAVRLDGLHLATP
jgi:hypothetical protein